MAHKLAADIAQYGVENVQVIQSDLTPDEMAQELERTAGQVVDLDAEQRKVLEGIDPSQLVGGTTGDDALDRELWRLQQESGQMPETSEQGGPMATVTADETPVVETFSSSTLEEVSPDEALAAMMAEMDSMGL